MPVPHGAVDARADAAPKVSERVSGCQPCENLRYRKIWDTVREVWLSVLEPLTAGSHVAMDARSNVVTHIHRCLQQGQHDTTRRATMQNMIP